jgi:hypothetical protein
VILEHGGGAGDGGYPAWFDQGRGVQCAFHKKRARRARRALVRTDDRLTSSCSCPGP